MTKNEEKYIITDKMIKIISGYIDFNQLVTYKQICQDFEWTFDSTGRSIKKAQFKTLDMMCEYEKVGKGKGLKYRFLKMHEEIKQRDDMRVRKIYTDNIDVALTYYLYDKMSDGIYDMSKTSALEIAGLVNGNFKECRKNIALTSLSLGIPIESVSHFIDKEYSKLISIFESSLKRLSKNRILAYTDSWFIVEKTNDERIWNLEDGSYEHSKVSRLANDDETQIILDTTNRILQDMNLKDMKEAYVRGKAKEVNKILNRTLQETLSIEYVYKGYHIITSKVGMRRKIDEYEAEYNKNMLNQKVVEEHMKAYVKEQEKSINIGDLLDFKASKYYISDIQCLMKNLIAIDSDDSLLKKMNDILNKKKNGDTVIFERNTYGDNLGTLDELEGVV